jgi:hypothetical protein
MANKPFIEILDECIDRVLRDGERIDACVAAYPEHAEELREALESAVQVQKSFAFKPDSDRKRAARLRMMQALDKRTSRRPNPLKSLLLATVKSSRRWAVVATALVVALSVGGTGTVLASSETIPGDTLYPVKRVSEQAQFLMIFSDEKEADLHAELLERRVQEMEEVQARGRQRFVPELAEQLEHHAQRARALAEAPVREVLAGTRGNQGSLSGTAEPGATLQPNNTPEVLSARVGILLQVNHQLNIVEQRLIILSDKPLDEETKRHLEQALRNIQVQYQKANQFLERAERMREAYTGDPADVERDVKELDEQGDATDATEGSNSSGEDSRPAPPGHLIRQRATIHGVDVTRTDGQVRVDLLLVMDDGQQQLVHLTRESKIKFLNAENKQATLHDLTVGGTVEMGVQPEDGAIKIIRLDPPNRNGGPLGVPTEGSFFYIEIMPADPGAVHPNTGSEVNASASKRQSS